MTTLADAAKLLALASAYDSRKPDEMRLHAWADALADLNPDDCAMAIREHYKFSTEFVMPAHIRQGVHKQADLRAARNRVQNPLRREIEATPKIAPGRVRALIEELAELRKLPEDVA